MAENDEDLEPSGSRRLTRQSVDNSLVDDASSKRKIMYIEEALDSLSAVNNSTQVRGDIRIHLAVDAVISHCMEYGLDPSQLQSLMAIVVKKNSKLTQAIRCKLVKCLAPSSIMPENVVVSAICYISQKIFVSPGPSSLDVLLLRWILLVLDYMDSYQKLHRLYGMIFNFVHSEKLLPYACHLLFLLTRKEDVRLFRVEMLQDLMKKMGSQPSILGLLTCYKVFRPSLVSVKLRCAHKTFFKSHDSVWKSTISSIVQKMHASHRDSRSDEATWECEKNQERLRLQPAKRQKLMIPKVHTAAKEHEEEAEVDGSTNAGGGQEVPFDQVDSFVHFLQVIDNIQVPSQMASSLGNARLQLLLSCNPDRETMIRLCLWIQHFFVYGFDRRNGHAEEEKNNALLKLLCQFSENVQSLPVVHGFLESFLPYWDGHSYIPVLFNLITCIQPCSYQELQSSILQPLFRLFFASDIYFKAMCLSSLTKLIKNFVFHMYSLQTRQKVDGKKGAGVGQEKNGTETATDSSSGDVSQEVGGIEEELLVFHECVEKLIKYLDAVVVVAMRMERDHVLLQHVTLDLLEMTSNWYKMYNVPVLCLPIRLIYRLLLSDCPGTVARLCGVINTFRENLVALRVVRAEGMSVGPDVASAIASASHHHRKALPSTSTVNMTCLDATLRDIDPGVFNSLLVDVLKMLWHGTIFTPSKTVQCKSVFDFPLPKSLDGEISSKCLTLYRGPTFHGLAYKFLKEVEHQGVKLKPSQIEDFKELYLEFLDRENFPQFKEFVNINLKSRQTKMRISSD